jgi:putative FmdB family regulatory protein
MPTYEYRCKSCGDQLEVVQAFTDDALTDCPSCGAEGQLRKVFGNIGITFKGSGFYKTDSRSGSSTSAKKDGESTTSTETKTESKPAETKSTDSSAPKPATPSTSSSTSAA